MTLRPALFALGLFSVGVAACSSSAESAPPPAPASTGILAPPPEGKGFQMGMDLVAPKHSEVWKCRIERLPVNEVTAVQSVEHAQTDAVHHMDVSILLNSGLDLPPGDYDCKPLYDQYPKLMEETILYAAQVKDAKIDLPKGVVAKVPPGLTVMYEVHYVNTTDEDKNITSRVNAYSIPLDEAKESIWGFATRNRNLQIPPKGEITEWSKCVMSEDVDVLFLTMHTHQLGEESTIYRFDGKETHEQLYRNDEWDNPRVKFLDPPMRVKKGEGFEFRCKYRNPTDRMVPWGFAADDEMCNMALVFTPGNPLVKCQQVENRAGEIIE